jgi:hypothetical protein
MRKPGILATMPTRKVSWPVGVDLAFLQRDQAVGAGVDQPGLRGL